MPRSVRELMTRNVRTCTPETSLRDAARIMSELNCGSLPVVRGERLEGIITDRDIVLRCVATGRDPGTATVRECMTAPAITASPEMDAHACADLMASRQIRRLPVVENGRLVGIVALGDLATERIHVDEAGQALSQISQPAQPGAH